MLLFKSQINNQSIPKLTSLFVKIWIENKVNKCKHIFKIANNWMDKSILQIIITKFSFLKYLDKIEIKIIRKWASLNHYLSKILICKRINKLRMCTKIMGSLKIIIIFSIILIVTILILSCLTRVKYIRKGKS